MKVKSDAPPAAAFRDRIIDFRRMKASELKANSKNWRLHPDSQKGAMKGILKEIGFVGAVIVRNLPDGSVELLDGHLRSDVAGDEIIPVLVTDLNDEEAAKMLATYDPMSALALVDEDQLGALLKEVDLGENAELRHLLAGLADELTTVEDSTGKGGKNDFEVPGMALQPHEHYDYLVVFASTTHDWNAICDKLGMQPEKRRGRMGICRAIRADKLLKVLEPKVGA